MDVQWTGDLDDDCTAVWHGYMLRAEWIDDDYWWWAVFDQDSGETLASSDTRNAPKCTTGAEARTAAQRAVAFYGLTGSCDDAPG